MFSPSVEMKALDCFETSACADPSTLPHIAVWLFPVEPRTTPAVPNAAQLSSNVVISVPLRSVAIRDPEVNSGGTVKCGIVYLSAIHLDQNSPLKTVAITLQDFEPKLHSFE